MGLLTSAPEGGADPISFDDSPADAPEAEAPETQEAAPAAVESVPLPEKALSTRERARLERQELANTVKRLEQTTQERESTWQRQLSEQQAMIARLTGNLEAMTRPQQQYQNQASPEDLIREATKALDEKDIDTYHRKTQEAHELRTRQMIDNALTQQRQSQPQQLSPEIQALVYQHPNVAAAGPRGMRLAAIKDEELALRFNLPPGPERFKKAFELANADLGAQQQTTASFPAASRGALSGMPTTRTNGTNKQPQIKPPAGNWKDWARRAGMSEAEYLQEHAAAHPESVDK